MLQILREQLFLIGGTWIYSEEIFGLNPPPSTGRGAIAAMLMIEDIEILLVCFYAVVAFFIGVVGYLSKYKLLATFLGSLPGFLIYLSNGQSPQKDNWICLAIAGSILGYFSYWLSSRLPPNLISNKFFSESEEK